MASNVEWKARARDPRHQQALAARLADGTPERLEQVDTFFAVPHGRLKLRRLAPNHGDLIHYVRADQAGPKESTYSIVFTDQPESLRALLAQALGIKGEVRKQRTLYRAGQARIHCDRVKGLGDFLEVEVVLRPGQSLEEGEQLAAALRLALEVAEDDLVAAAYVDLLAAAPG